MDEISAGSITHMNIDQGKPDRGQPAVLLSITNKCKGKGERRGCPVHLHRQMGEG